MHYFGQLLWTIISAALVILAVSFAIANNAMISLSLWPLTQNIVIPTWLFGVGAFVIGGILGAVSMGGQMLAIRAKLWRAQSQIKKFDNQAAQAPQKEPSQTLTQTLDT